MSNPVSFPFHATVKWPAQGGLPDVMVNVYAEEAAELAERIGEAIEAARAAVPVLAAAPAAAPARREEVRYVPDQDETPRVTCMHGSREWLPSQWGGWWISACKCKLNDQGELKAVGDSRRGPMPGTRPGRYPQYAAR